MEKNRIIGLLFIVLSVMFISIGSSKILKDGLFNGEIEISKDEIKEVNNYLKNKYGIKSSNTVVFEEYYKDKYGNTSVKKTKNNLVTNRIYLVKYKDVEFYVKKESAKREKYYDNYVNISLNDKLSKYLKKNYSNYDIKKIDIKEYDNSKYILQNNSSLYSKDLLKISNKEYLKLLKNSEQEITLQVKDSLNKKNIKKEVNKLIDIINKEKELNICSFSILYRNDIYIEYYRDTISIYSEDKEIYDKYIVLDKKHVSEGSIYLKDFMKLDVNKFNF